MKIWHRILVLSFLSILPAFAMAAKPTEDEYAKKLRKIQKDIPLTYNQYVKAEIERLIANKGDSTSRILGLGNLYFPAMERLLKIAGVPSELKYLAPALSNLNNVAVSDVGASGLWQLMYNTGKMQGLKINSYTDERRDADKATTAAANYLKELKVIYEDWHLSIAALVATPLNVNHAIRSAGGSINYWQVHGYLPEAAQHVLPRFIAFNYIFVYYKDHGIKPIPAKLIIQADTVTVKEWVSFQQIAKVLNVSVEDLRTLNPIFKKDIIPFGEPLYTLKLPIALVDSFKKYEDSIYKVDVDAEVSDFVKTVIPKNSTPNTPRTSTTNNQGTGTVKVYYTVKNGDVLGNIADWFDTYVSNVKRWNGLRNDRIYAGQKLTLYVPASKKSYYQSINTMSQSQKRNIAAKD